MFETGTAENVFAYFCLLRAFFVCHKSLSIEKAAVSSSTYFASVLGPKRQPRSWVRAEASKGGVGLAEKMSKPNVPKTARWHQCSLDSRPLSSPSSPFFPKARATPHLRAIITENRARTSAGPWFQGSFPSDIRRPWKCKFTQR